MSFTQPASKFHDQLLVKQHPFSSTKHHLSSYLLLNKPNHVLAPNLIYSFAFEGSPINKSTSVGRK